MPSRERAEYNGQIVTVLQVTGRGRNADVEIRDLYGRTKTVKNHELKKLADDDNRKTFKFAGP